MPIAPAWSRRLTSERPPPLLLVGLAGAAVAAAGCAVALAYTSDHVDEPGIQAALMTWMILSYCLGGLAAWRWRPGPFGPLMVGAGFGIFLSSLSWSNWAFLFTIGILFDLVAAVLFIHVFLAFPSGRLQSPVSRALLALGYFAASGLQLVGLMLGGFGPDNIFTVVSEPEAAYELLKVQLVIISGVSLASLLVLFARRRVVGRPLRRSLAILVHSFAFVLVMIAVLFLSAAFGLLEGQTTFETIRRITFASIGLAAVVFAVAMLDTRLRQGSVTDLIVELGANRAPGDLEPALARALQDPSVDLAYWLPDYGVYADLDGRPVTLPAAGERRSVTYIGGAQDRVGALVHDPGLDDEPELLSAVTAAAGIALENNRLQAELRARLEELAGSRARVVEAGQQERQRLERNLHDGAQQRLVALNLQLRLLELRLGDDPEAQRGLDEARGQIEVSLAELRDVARGLHPAVVSAHGLEVALEEIAAFASVPVRLDIDLDGRPPETIEVAAYYVVCESLANIGKHAAASSATIDVTRSNGSIVVEVSDDGVGGADTERGSGLRGLADRVEALGGRLRIWTPHGGGTRVRAELPCES